MKKLIISILLLGVNISYSWSQDLLGFENISGNDRMDYKTAEVKVLEAATYLLTTAIDSDKAERDKYLSYMLMWMEGTPDYVFYIDENVNFITRSNPSLLALYMAILTKLSLENPTLALSHNELKYRTIELFIDYCTNPSNHVRSYRQLEQLVKAKEKGRLKNYIDD